MGDWIKKNPVWFISSVEAIVAAVLNLILVFGVTVTDAQIGYINAAVMIVVTFALGLWAQAPIQALIDKAKEAGILEGARAAKI